MENSLKRKTNDTTPMYELKQQGWIEVPRDYEQMLHAILNYIDSKLGVYYWNKNQKEISSPFLNTGESYSNMYMTIRAYNWDENELPNFDTDKLKITWYKHSQRGLYAMIPAGEDIDQILKGVLNDALLSLEIDFGKFLA